MYEAKQRVWALAIACVTLISPGAEMAEVAAKETVMGMATERVVTFEAPHTARRSDTYTVEAGGNEVFVEHFADIHYARFAFSGTCEVKVSIPPSIGHRNLKYIDTYSIVPKRYGVRPTTALNTLTLTIEGPQTLVLRINEYERLIVFADAVGQGAPRPGDEGVVNVKDFVTDSTGAAVQTDNLQKAIAAVGEGGVLYFPPGVYLTGAIRLKSNMTMYLDGGALLQGSSRGEDYPPDTEFWHWAQQQLVQIREARNVRVTGYGTIDGAGHILRAQQHGPHIMVIGDSSDVTVENVILRNPASQNTHPVNSENLVFRNVKVIDNRNVLNADGIDLSSVRGAVVEDCFTYTADDAIVVKAYGGHKSADIVARRNVILTKKSALKVGTETEADITDVTFIDNDVVECDRGMSLYVEDGATLKDISYINNRFENFYPDARRRLLDFYIWNRSGGGNIENVLIKDCVADVRWPRPSTMIGLDGENAIRGVRFENFTLAGKVCTSLEEADVIVEVYPYEDVRRPHVFDITFEPEGDRPWNPAILDERE